VTLPAALSALTAYPRFVTYEMYPDPDRPGKTIKRPTDVRTGLWCKVTDPKHHYTYADAAATGRPVGFVFMVEDGFWFLDIDSALEETPAGPQWSALATDFCTRLAGAAVEVSQSGRGLHIIGRGAVPEHSCKNIPLGLELYTQDRFVALTGISAAGDAAFDHTATISAIATGFFPPNPHGEIAGWTAEPVPDWGGPVDDEELIKVACASGKKSAAAAFGDASKVVTFGDLWTANEEALARKWPGDKGGFDASNADAALASHLAFWTGKDHERIRRLMERSALARPKWEERPDWLETTIMRAASVVGKVAAGRPLPEGVSAEAAAAHGITLRAGSGYKSAADQLEYFAGCVYVVADNKVWIPETGDMLDAARFNVVYGGYLFPVDGQNEKTTDNAFDAFTKSRVFAAPRVTATCFRPEHAAGAVIQEDGRTLVNTYFPIETKRIAGDPGPFLRHVERMLPDARDRSILLHYMASMRQNPGRKFQWWPVIQGAEGNGKTLLDRAMAFAMGYRYSHLVNPEAMAKTGNQFNSWIMGNLYLGIEEIYVGHRREFLESFKATVTNDRVPIEGKGSNQTTGDNRINGLLFTNHKEAVPIDVDSRRYSIFYTAQQSNADIIAAGMGGGYFPDLYDWVYGRGDYAHLGPNYGLAVINNYLCEMPLTAELDPAGLCVRAPATTSTSLALRLSLGKAEQEILEAVEEGRPGFAGGWISSIALDRLLEHLRAPVPRNKRKDMLEALGYFYHPGLHDGRVNNTVAPDNGKPRLFVTIGHLSCNLTDAAAIAKAYTAAQHVAGADGAAARFG
jgi:hypothetical protein